MSAMSRLIVKHDPMVSLAVSNTERQRHQLATRHVPGSGSVRDNRREHTGTGRQGPLELTGTTAVEPRFTSGWLQKPSQGSGAQRPTEFFRIGR